MFFFLIATDEAVIMRDMAFTSIEIFVVAQFDTVLGLDTVGNEWVASTAPPQGAGVLHELL